MDQGKSLQTKLGKGGKKPKVTFQELIPYGALVTGALLIITGAKGLTSAFQGSMKKRLARIALSTPLIIVGTLTRCWSFPKVIGIG